MTTHLYTVYSITETDGTEHTYKAITSNIIKAEPTGDMDIKALLDIHNEKVGAIERKLLK